MQICVCVPRKNVHSKAHRLLAHNANVLLYADSFFLREGIIKTLKI